MVTLILLLIWFLYLTLCLSLIVKSDHLGIKLELQLKGPSCGVKYHTSRLVWNYAEADWERGCQLICAFDWNTLLSNDINAACMDKLAPHVYQYHGQSHSSGDILSPRRNLPWMSAGIMKALKCKPSAYIFLHVHLSLFPLNI